MLQRLLIRPTAIKAESERHLFALGARVCDWLPWIEHTTPRTARAIAERVLVLHAVIQIAFEAPPHIIRGWLQDNALEHALAPSERTLVAASEQPLPETSKTNLLWSIEALWALMWVCGRVPRLQVEAPVADTLASLLPDLQANEPAAPFYAQVRLRSYRELYSMRDLVYRAHWYARDGQLNGYPTPPISLDIIMERRKAIEWASDRTQDWDHTNANT